MQAIFVECVLGGVQEERVRKMAKQSLATPLRTNRIRSATSTGAGESNTSR